MSFPLLACSLLVFSGQPVYAAAKKATQKPAQKKAAPAVSVDESVLSGPRYTMMNTVDAALAFNPELKATQEGRRMAEHAVRRAKAGHYPTASAFAGGGGSRRSDYTTREHREQQDFRGIADAGMRLTMPIFHGMGPTRDVEARTAELDSATSGMEDTGARIVFDAIAAHTEVVRRAQLVILAKNNVLEHADILKTVEQRYRSGVATDGELNQIKSRHSRAKATLASYEAALDAAKANYIRITGQRPLRLEPTPPPRKLFSDLDSIRNTAIEHQPRIQAALADIRAAKGDKGLAKSRYYPHVDLGAGPSWSDRDSDASLRTSDMVAEVRVNWEFYSGGADKATVDMAGARVRQARQTLHAIMNYINEDIEASFSRMHAAAKEAREYADAKKSSRLAREDYYRQFLEAQRSLIDVLDAENDYFYAASQEVLSQSDRVLAGYRLLTLSGILLPELKLDPKTLRIATPTTVEDMPDPTRDFKSPLAQGWRKGFDNAHATTGSTRESRSPQTGR
ncbi:TolC family protein [Desulfovibrio sp. OttesenSCG-928-G15]|nr:TolC family protein [Desulfovibrio sp. OttesenSCG-928-G15]